MFQLLHAKRNTSVQHHRQHDARPFAVSCFCMLCSDDRARCPHHLKTQRTAFGRNLRSLAQTCRGADQASAGRILVRQTQTDDLLPP
jgi:hypothetical protein